MEKELKAEIESKISSNKIMIFSKSYCPYCLRTKATLRWKGVAYDTIELDWAQRGKEMQDILEEISGQRTVPNIYINGKHIGGNRELQVLNSSGELDLLLK